MYFCDRREQLLSDNIWKVYKDGCKTILKAAVTIFTRRVWLTIITHDSFLADRTNGRAYATVLRPSVCLSVVVCDVMYCG